MINKDLLSLMGSDKKKIFKITANSLFAMIANVIITACICISLYLAYVGNFELSSYAPLILIVALCLVVRYITTIASGRMKSEIGSKVKSDFRTSVTQKMYRLGMQSGGNSPAKMTQLIIEGIEQLNLYYTLFLPQFFYGMSAPILLFVICLFLQWKTAVVLIVCLPLIPISIIAVSRFAKKIFAKYWDKYISMGDGFLDSVNGMNQLIIFDADGEKQKEIAKKSEEFRKITMKVLVMQLASLTIIDMVAFGGAGIAIVTTLQNSLSDPKSVFIALFLVLICAEFFLPMRGLASAFHVAMNGNTAGNTLMEFLKIKECAWGDDKLGKIQDVTLSNVTFRYVQDKDIIKNLNITLGRGLNSIVGESGSGKSTITSLITGENDVNGGEILVNNKPLKNYDKKAFYGETSITSVNSHIFNISIRENFKLADENVSDKEIFASLEKVNMLEFAKTYGLDYIIAEDAQNISGGQKQRLCFAIATIKKKSLYIFDEPTSNIDIESEKIIMKNIQILSKEAVIILISHRLQNVVSSNQIFMLKDKNAIEVGTHEKLISQKGEYYKLYKKQYDMENSYKGEVYA